MTKEEIGALLVELAAEKKRLAAEKKAADGPLRAQLKRNAEALKEAEDLDKKLRSDLLDMIDPDNPELPPRISLARRYEHKIEDPQALIAWAIAERPDLLLVNLDQIPVGEDIPGLGIAQRFSLVVK